VYLSLDIEADGPIPGPYSMLSFGLAVAGRFDGKHFERHDPGATAYYDELRPISNLFDAEALCVSGLDRPRLLREGTAPEMAMQAVCEWIEAVARGGTPVIVGYPVVYDWMFFYWYVVRFGPPDPPISFSSALDTKTMYQEKARVVLTEAGRSHLPHRLRGRSAHTHHARDDAIEQAEVFANVFTWEPHH
jgi:hypothetical protein